MEDVYQKSLIFHEKFQGKLEINSKVPISNTEELSLAYTPGVAQPCREIAKNKKEVYRYTSKGNMVAVITDGSAVLGLGDIGPEAALPVMEGKSILFKKLANIDSFPLCLNTKNVEEIILICKSLEPSLGGINLEDISAPRCVEIETRLKAEMSIPVFHDDQHGTAIVVAAALLNACRFTNKEISTLRVVVVGTGAAGSSIIKLLKKIGVQNVLAYNKRGVLHVNNPKATKYDAVEQDLLSLICKSKDYNSVDARGSLSSILKESDVFIGVSVANLLTQEMVSSMNKNAFIFAMANPSPEIMPEVAVAGGALIIGTGRSDYPNQINNMLAFPGIFRGALDAKAVQINEEMKLAAIEAIASVISTEELRADYIIPLPFDKRVVAKVARYVKEAAIKTGVAKK